MRVRSALAWCLVSVCGLPAAAQLMDAGPARAIEPLQSTRLYLQTGEVDTSVAKRDLSEAMRGRSLGQRAVVQLEGPITPERRAAMEAAGVRLGAYLPANAYVADLSGANANAVAGLDFVRWYGSYEASWKLEPTLAQKAAQGVGNVEAVVTLFEGEDANRAMAQIRGLNPGGLIWRSEEVGGQFELAVEGPAAAIASLTQLDGVQFVEPAPVITYRNATSSWIVQSNSSGQRTLWDQGLRGEGQVIGVLDGQVDIDHCSFSDSNPVGPLHRKVLAYNASGSSDHGTHVAGTALGDNGVDNDTRGVAYMAKMVSHTTPSFTESGILGRLNLHHSQGGRIHTNSWGNDGTTSYDSLARGFDVFLYDNEESFVCLAATNGGSLRNPENAKNLLACGASQDFPNQGAHCSGGVGPTNDGRRKPELYAPGCGTASARWNTACSTISFTGTSMATPAIAGTAAMVRQYYMEGFYPSGSANPSDAFTPTGTLIKATLLNSSVDMTSVSGFPSNLEGWGRVLADNSLHFTGESRTTVLQDVRNAQGLSTGGVSDLAVNVQGPGELLSVTLVWTEPAGAAGTSFASVNDLDLEVIAPGGVTYLGNVFSGGESATGGSKDDRNNVEQVRLSTPSAGAYIVRVRGAAVAQGTQGFAVVVTGEVDQGPVPLSVGLDSSVPTLLEAGLDLPVQVSVSLGDDTLLDGPTLWHRAGGGAYASLAMSPSGGDSYAATIPGANCDEPIEFYVEASGDLAGGVSLPAAGATDPYVVDIGVLNTLVGEDFEVDTGWSVSGDAGDGQWTRGVPVGGGDRNDPPTDADGSGQCWLTDNVDGNSDVDDGTTILTSSLYDLPAGSVVEYRYWFDGSTSGDEFGVDYSSDGGSSWARVRTVTSYEASWRTHVYVVGEDLAASSQARFRFSANDVSPQSVTEAGLDGLVVTQFECVPVAPACPGDVNTTGGTNGVPDGTVNLSDLQFYLNLWQTDDAAADVNTTGEVNGQPDGDVNLSDLQYYLGQWQSGTVQCP